MDILGIRYPSTMRPLGTFVQQNTIDILRCEGYDFCIIFLHQIFAFFAIHMKGE